MKKQTLTTGALLFSLLVSFSARADLTFGAEFTFTNAKILAASTNSPGIVNIPEAEAARDLFRNQVLKNCDGCRMVTEKNSYGVQVYKFIYPDDWYFVIATDPAVVEVQTKPSTTEQIEKIKARIQKDIFDSAKETGIEPHISAGGGHIHFDYLAATEGNLLLLRNLLVDFANNPETAQGIWAQDYHNSPPISEQPEAQRQAFIKLIADVDSGRITTTKEFVKVLRNKVYTYQRGNWEPKDKYQALNVNRVNDSSFKDDEKTLEVRGIRPEKSAMEYLTLIKVLAGRVELNKTRKTPLALNMPPPRGSAMVDADMMTRHLNYVAEAGVEPQTYIQGYQASLPQRFDYKALLQNVKAVTIFCSRIFAQ